MKTEKQKWTNEYEEAVNPLMVQNRQKVKAVYLARDNQVYATESSVDYKAFSLLTANPYNYRSKPRSTAVRHCLFVLGLW